MMCFIGCPLDQGPCFEAVLLVQPDFLQSLCLLWVVTMTEIQGICCSKCEGSIPMHICGREL